MTQPNNRQRGWVVAGWAMLTTVAVAVAACGVPTGDSSFRSIDGAELAGINESTSTTTSTTSTTTTTTMPDVGDSTPESSTTTTTAVPLETVTLYFIARQLLQPTERFLQPDYTDNLLIAALEAGPEDGSFALESYVTPGLIVGQPNRDRGVLNVELDPTEYRRMTTRIKRFAIAQIVLTMTENLAGIGQVAFFVDGEPEAVPTDRGTLELVTRDDLRSLETGAPSSAAEPEGETPVGQTTTTIAQ